MDKVTSGIGIMVLGVFMIAFGAFFAGTILWAIWPIAIPVALPGLVAKGYLAAELAWWPAVCLCWIAGILFKSTTTINK